MGSIEDSRKAVQDFLAPDLKAFAARLEALEKEMHAEFAHAEETNRERLKSLENKMAEGFAHAEKMSLERFASVEKLAAVRQETLLSIMAANHANIMNTLEMEKRLTRLESERKAEPSHA